MAGFAGDAYARVDEPMPLRGKRLRSRVYLPAHQPGLAEDGLPRDRYVEYHRRRARAGLGMQITGATPVLWSEVWAGGLTLINIDDHIIPGYRRLAAAVHAEGGLMLAQLAHVGAMETRATQSSAPRGPARRSPSRPRARLRLTSSPKSWNSSAPRRSAAAPAISTASRSQWRMECCSRASSRRS